MPSGSTGAGGSGWGQHTRGSTLSCMEQVCTPQMIQGSWEPPAPVLPGSDLWQVALLWRLELPALPVPEIGFTALLLLFEQG